MAAFVRNTRRYNRQAYGKPANTLEFTIDRDSDGALGNQIYLLGHFDLEDEEALVVDVRLGGARYFIAPNAQAFVIYKFVTLRMVTAAR